MKEVFIKKEELNKWVAKYFELQDLISIDDLLGVIEDLDDEITNLQEKINDMEDDIRDNYMPIPVSEQVDVSDIEFY